MLVERNLAITAVGRVVLPLGRPAPQGQQRSDHERSFHKEGRTIVSSVDPYPADGQCNYPGCGGTPLNDDVDLCKRHMGQWGPNKTEPEPGLRENDGIVDWRAIQLVARGERRVPLTWVERDIAIAMILGQGLDVGDIADRTGYMLDHTCYKFRRLLDLGRRHYGIRLSA